MDANERDEVICEREWFFSYRKTILVVVGLIVLFYAEPFLVLAAYRALFR